MREWTQMGVEGAYVVVDYSKLSPMTLVWTKSA